MMLKWYKALDKMPNESNPCVFHIPLAGYPHYTVTGHLDYRGNILDACGDCVGYEWNDVANWAYLNLPDTEEDDMYESVDEIPKDLKYLATAFHVWPKGAVRVRLDGDGEICFGPHIDSNFYPKDLEEAKRNYLDGENYSESDWINARSIMGISTLQYKPENVAFKHDTIHTTPGTRVSTSRGNGTIKLEPDVNGYITVQLDTGEYVLISPGFCEELDSEEDAMGRWVKMMTDGIGCDGYVLDDKQIEALEFAYQVMMQDNDYIPTKS